MKVVFLEEVEGTARTGDVKNVADGFARNFLLPRQLAAPATDHYIAIAQAKAGKEARRQERLDEEARQHVLPKVEGQSVTIEVRVGEQDKLFGSVTGRDIAEKLQEATKVELDHKQIDLKQPIREVGSHQVTVKLTRNVHATVTVNVEPMGGVEAAAEEAAEAGAEAITQAAEAAHEAVEAGRAVTESGPEAQAEAAAEAAVEAAQEEPAAAADMPEEPAPEMAEKTEEEESPGGESDEETEKKQD
jgi:large subunit ribosomal protein L9